MNKIQKNIILFIQPDLKYPVEFHKISISTRTMTMGSKSHEIMSKQSRF